MNKIYTYDFPKKAIVAFSNDIKEELLDLFYKEDVQSIIANLENIDTIDSSAIQIIYAAKKLAIKKNIEFTLTNPNLKIEKILIKTGFVHKEKIEDINEDLIKFKELK